jgi:hypothetical protein
MMEQMRALNDSEDLEICKRILVSITLAYQPIHLEELVTIAGLPEEFSDDQESLEELVGLCGSFLIIRKRTIYFIHQSAKDYFSTDAKLEIFPHGRGEGHSVIVSRSLQGMSNTLKRDIYDLRNPGYLMSKLTLSIQILSLQFNMPVSTGSTIYARLIVVCTVRLAYVITGQSIYF